MEDFSNALTGISVNPQDIVSQAQTNFINSEVNGINPENSHCTDPVVSPSISSPQTPSCKNDPALSTVLTGDLVNIESDNRVVEDSQIDDQSPLPKSVEICSFPELPAPQASPVSHASSGLVSDRNNQMSCLSQEVSYSEKERVASPLNEGASNVINLDALSDPLQAVSCDINRLEHVPTNNIHDEHETLADTSKAKNVKEHAQRAVTAANEEIDLKAESATVQQTILGSNNSLASEENIMVEMKSSSTEQSVPMTVQPTVVNLEQPRNDKTELDIKSPVRESTEDNLAEKVLTAESTEPLMGPIQGTSSVKENNVEHLANVPPTQTVTGNASGLLKNAVLVEAPIFEPVEPVEDMKPVVGGCVDGISREYELQDNLAIEPCGLFVDDTTEVQDYDAIDPIAVTKIDPIITLEVPILDPNGMNDDADSDSDKDGLTEVTQLKSVSNVLKTYSSPSERSDLEAEQFEPDMTECGEMIGLATDDELELKRSMCAKVKSRNIVKRSVDSKSTGDNFKDNKLEEEPSQNGTMHKQPLLRKKKRKIHSIRIVDVKKELLNIQDQPPDDCTNNYASKKIKSDHKRKRKSSSSNDSGSGLSCEEILDDDCLHDTPKAETKRGRSSKASSSCTTFRQTKRVEEIAGLKLPVHQQEQLQHMVLKKKKNTHGRFYDRSQDIPNDIYFENMNVPLHILHATSSSSSDEERELVESKKQYRPKSSVRNRNSSSSSAGRNETSNRSLSSMKLFLRTAGFRHLRYQKLWKDCHTNQDRAEAILRFLHEHGLQGEPTFEKCRELRKQIQLENEAKVLDVSAIINAGEGRVTRQRTKQMVKSSVSASGEPASEEFVEPKTPRTEEESVLQSGEQHSKCHSEQRMEANQHQSNDQSVCTPNDDEPTKCHNEQDVLIEQQQKVQQNVMQTWDETAQCHDTQPSNDSKETAAQDTTEESKTSIGNPTVQS